MRIQRNVLVLTLIVTAASILIPVAHADERLTLVPLTTSLNSTVVSDEVHGNQILRPYSSFDLPYFPIYDGNFELRRRGDGRFLRQGLASDSLSSTSSSLTGTGIDNTEISGVTTMVSGPVEVQLLLQSQSPPNYSSGAPGSLNLLSEDSEVTVTALPTAFQGTTIQTSSSDLIATSLSSQVGVEPVPEPSTLALAGMAGVLFLARIIRKA